MEQKQTLTLPDFTLKYVHAHNEMLKALRAGVRLLETIAQQHPEDLWLGSEYEHMKRAIESAEHP